MSVMWSITSHYFSGITIAIVLFTILHCRTVLASSSSSTTFPVTDVTRTETHNTSSRLTHAFYYISVTIVNRYGRKVMIYSSFADDTQITRVGILKNAESHTIRKKLKSPTTFLIGAYDHYSTTKGWIKIHGYYFFPIQPSKTPGQRRFIYVDAPTGHGSPFTYTPSTENTTTATASSTAATTTETSLTHVLSTDAPTTEEIRTWLSSGSSMSTVQSGPPTTTTARPTRQTSTTEVTARNVYKTNETKSNITLYVALGVGAVASLVFSIIFFVLVQRKIRKHAELKKRAKYWEKINRACMSQYMGNEEVATDNPMYEGSRSRSTSNVLYGVPDDDSRVINASNYSNRYETGTPVQQQPELVIENACAIYHNAAVIYSEPTSARLSDSGNYERIRSFVQSENDQRENSYVEPSVLFNGMFLMGSKN